MTRPRYAIIVFLLIYSVTLIVFAHDDNFDSYCGKNFSSAQNNCPLRCASGTDKECIDILGEGYKCFNSTGCSERIKNRELNDGNVGEGVCASTLKGAVMGCGYEDACSGDLDCGGAELCYSDICGYRLMELHSEFLFTMIRIERPMDQAAERTFIKALTLVLEQIMNAFNIVLDSVTVMDSRQTGTILYTNVKLLGLHRPQMMAINLGQLVIDAFNSGAQQEFTNALGNNYFSGVIGVFLSLKKNESRPAPPPTPAPTVSIKVETLPPNIVPSTVVEPSPLPPPTLSWSISTQPPTVSPTEPPTEPGAPTIGPFFLAVLIQNTPYQTRYMEDRDFDKFAEAFKSTVDAQLEDSMTVVRGVTLGYHQLISLGNRVTATEINFEYMVSTNLTESDVGKKVSRAVGRNRLDMIASLRGERDSFPYFLEVKEIQAQNIASIGVPGSTTTLPKNIPERPITQPPTYLPTISPSIPKVEEVEEVEVEVEKEEEDAGISVADLLASDAEKVQAAKDEAMAKANATQFNLNETEAAEVIKETVAVAEPTEKDEPGGLEVIVYAGTGAGVMFCFMAAGLSLIYIKKRRRRTGKRKREVDEDAVTGDSKSKKSAPKRELWTKLKRGSATTDVESDEIPNTTSGALPDTSHDNSERNASVPDIETGVKTITPNIPDTPEENVGSSLTSLESSEISFEAVSNSPGIPMGGDDFQLETVQPKLRIKRIKEDESSDSDSSSSDDDSSSDSSSDESEEMKARIIRQKRQLEAMGSEFAEENTKQKVKKDRPFKPSSKSSRKLIDESKNSGSGKSRRNLNDEGKLYSGQSRRNLDDKRKSRRNLNDEGKLYSGQSRRNLDDKRKSRRNLNDEGKLSSGRSTRNLGDKRKSRRNLNDEGKLSSGQSTRNLGDERKLPSGKSRRRLTADETSARPIVDRPPKSFRKSTGMSGTPSVESGSSHSSRRRDSGSSHSSRRGGAGDSKRDGKLSSEKSRRINDQDRDEIRRERIEKRRERRSKNSFPEESNALQSSDRSGRSKLEDSDRPEALSRSVGSAAWSMASDRNKGGERRRSRKNSPKSPKRDLQRSKSRRDVN